jgi:hypothetical protein
MFSELDTWAAWAAGRYLIGTVVAVVFGAFPLFRGQWLGVIPMAVGGVFLIRTRRRHLQRNREVATADVDDLSGSTNRVSRPRSRV